VGQFWWQWGIERMKFVYHLVLEGQIGDALEVAGNAHVGAAADQCDDSYGSTGVEQGKLPA